MPAKWQQIWSRLLHVGFRLLYQEMAWIYDAVSWLVSFGAWRDWQRAALPYLRGPHVLEIAHGPGHMLLALHQAGYQVCGLDRSPQMGTLSRRRLQQAGAALPLLRGIAQQLPFPAQTFDSVLTTFPTEFVGAEETIAAVWRVLKEKGRFIIVPQARFTGHSLPENVVEWLYRITGQRPEEDLFPQRKDQTRQSFYASHLSVSFRNAGFEWAVESVPLERSVVTVIVATKKPNGPIYYPQA